MTTIFSTSPNFVCLFELISVAQTNQKMNKSSLCSQTYSWTIFIPLSRKRTSVFTINFSFWTIRHKLCPLSPAP